MYRFTLIFSSFVFLLIGCGSDDKKEEITVRVETSEDQLIISDSATPTEVTTATMSKATIKPPPVSIRKGNFTVQIGAFRTESRAHEAIVKYNNMGYDAYLEEAEVGGSDRVWFRVRIGRYRTSSEAKRTADELNAKGNIKAWVDKVSK